MRCVMGYFIEFVYACVHGTTFDSRVAHSSNGHPKRGKPSRNMLKEFANIRI